MLARSIANSVCKVTKIENDLYNNNHKFDFGGIHKSKIKITQAVN